MKNILVLGAGQSTPYLIRRLLDRADANGWFVTVGDRNLALARQRVDDHPRGEAIEFDVTDTALLAGQVEKADLVVNLLAPVFQHQVAWECVEHGTHMISASYRDRQIRDLHTDAERRGLLILNEVGLDPGIDHMSAMALIHRIRKAGGRVTSFVSYGSGVPAPDSLSNPLKYVITWNPRNVVMSAEHGAQYLIDGKIKIVPYPHVFQRSWPVEVDGLGTMEAYPNRDSLSYRQTYGLEHVHTMIRGTLRWPGWSETWLQIVRLGLPNENMRIPGFKQRSYREVIEMFIPRNVAGAQLEQRVATHLNISPTGQIMDNLRWLGLFSEEPIGIAGETAADMMMHLLRRKLAFGPDGRDMVVLAHELEVDYGRPDGRRERITTTLIEYGQPDGFTAMAKTVGLPAAISVELLLNGELPLSGCYDTTPTAIYTPILAELENEGLVFKEKTTPLTP
ncbi:MAG: saccharopine dehydrogenase [bacterium]|nr:saccharopine dehydrogenase [bacterium]